MSKNRRDEDKEFLKSMYKYMLKKYGKTASNSSRTSSAAKTIVEDILDPNGEAEVNPDKIPSSKTGVMRKAKGEEKQRRKKLGSKASNERRKAHTKTGTMKDGKKFSYPDDPRSGHHYGINQPRREDKPGESGIGNHIRTKSNPVIPLKEQRKDKIRHLKNAPKPNLPKNEQGMEKGNEGPKPPKSAKPKQLPANRPKVKGVKRLKNYVESKKKR